MSRLGCVLACIVAISASAELGAQDSRCADCHLANPDAPETGHLIDWERSAHGRGGVGCDSCHGGDPSTFDRLRAHLGVLGSRNPASLAHRDNLPQTCGKCHPGPFVAFQKSRHFALLGEGDPAVPVCSTCHGEVAAQLLSPRALEARCQRCHREGGVAPAHAPLAARARELLEGVDQVRALLHQAHSSIRRIRDAERRARLEAELTQVAVPLHEAVEAGHAFVFDSLEDRLGLARRRAEALLDRVVNPAD
jgi:Cytochrome c7 and related cytochrome c/Cytochrome c554 and c-prime